MDAIKIEKPEKIFNYKRFLPRLFGSWKLILIFIFVGLILGFLRNQFTPNTYKVIGKIHLAKERNPFFAGVINVFEWGGPESKTNISVELLSTRQHNEKVVKRLNNYIIYKREKKYSPTYEVYGKECPFKIKFDTADKQCINCTFLLKYKGHDQFEISLKDIPKNLIFHDYQTKREESIPFESDNKFSVFLDQTIDFYGAQFRLEKNTESGINFKEGDIYSFKFITLRSSIDDLLVNLEIKAQKKSYLITITKQGHSIEKMVAYINASIDQIIETELISKNQVAVETIDFLKYKVDSADFILNKSDDTIKGFRNNREIINIDQESGQFYSNIASFERQATSYENRLRSLNSVLDYLNSGSQYNNTILATSGLTDNILNQLSNKLIKLNVERKELSEVATGDNPLIKSLTDQIEGIKSDIKVNVENQKNIARANIASISHKLKTLRKDLKRLPGNDQGMQWLKRRYMFDQRTLYFLKEKRLYAELIRASNISDIKIIERARNIGQSPIAPKKKNDMAIALVFALMIPFFFLIIMELIDNKIRSVQDLKDYSNIPLLGVIGKNKLDSSLVALAKSKSSITETFRILRSSLHYILASSKEKNNQSILVTSSVSGEGKTFISINLAIIFAQTEKKTVLVGMDLRKPRIFSHFNIENKVGLTNYLIGDATKEEIVQYSGIENLDIIVSGPVPPNPSELLLSKELEKLVIKLKYEYDIIVMDTPPLILVADTWDLTKYADGIIYIVRQGKTINSLISNIDEKYIKGEIKNISFVLNDYTIPTGYGYGYGYGWYGYGGYGYGGYGYGGYGYGGYGYGGYGYGKGNKYGYYEDDDANDKKSFIKKVRSLFKRRK